LKLFFNNISWF